MFLSEVLTCGVSSAKDMEYQTIRVSEEGERYSISIEYSLAKFGNENPLYVKRINRAILKWLKKNIMVEIPKIRVINTKQDENAGAGMNAYEVQFHINYFSDEIISIEFILYYHFIEAIHEYFKEKTFNYFPKTGQVVQFKDLFVKGSDYLHQISEYAIQDFLSRYKNDDMRDWDSFVEDIKENAGPKEKNFDSFGISKDSLIIYFDQYDIGGYMNCLAPVKIPYKKLRGLSQDFIKKLNK